MKDVSDFEKLSSEPSIERGSPKTMVAAFVTQSQSDHTIMFKSIAHAFVKLTFVTNLQLVQLVGYKDSSDRYSIGDSDNKNPCQGSVKKNASYRYSINKSDPKNASLAEVKGEISYYYLICDSDQKTLLPRLSETR
ncbi:MAG: hypothetical protein HY253_13925 [Burkholderiales bacterium]|nr:hypothetical protein [Burkholderiales bacterium]